MNLKKNAVALACLAIPLATAWNLVATPAAAQTPVIDLSVEPLNPMTDVYFLYFRDNGSFIERNALSLTDFVSAGTHFTTSLPLQEIGNGLYNFAVLGVYNNEGAGTNGISITGLQDWIDNDFEFNDVFGVEGDFGFTEDELVQALQTDDTQALNEFIFDYTFELGTVGATFEVVPPETADGFVINVTQKVPLVNFSAAALGGIVNGSLTAVPEPGTFALMGVGLLAGVGAFVKRRRAA